MSAKQLLIFRPNVSQYQSKDFREQEKSALIKNPNHIYVENYKDLDKYPECPIVVISTSNLIADEFLSKVGLNRIILWIHPNSGYDNLPQNFIQSSDFPIIVGNNIRANAVYLYTVQCLLDSLGKIPFKKQWEPTRKFERKSFRKENILIIGNGHIGKKFINFVENSELEYQLLEFSQNPEEIDYSLVTSVVVLASLNKSSKQLLNNDFFEKLNKNVTIINPARGKIIDENALIKYLEKSPESKVYLDVFEKEPCDFEKFNFHKHIHLSSHVAGVYEDIDQVIIEHEKDVIENYLNLSKEDFENKYKSLILRNKIKNDILI